MRSNQRKPFPELLFALLAAPLCLALSDQSHAQSATRSFQMTLWVNATDSAVPAINQDADIQMFADVFNNQFGTQPPGPSIVIGLDWGQPLQNRPYDWSRIVAIEVDEPYTNLISKHDYHTPCTASSDASTRESNLRQRAQELESIAPWVRFWVNFTADEIKWIQDPTCTTKIDQDYVDVISVDAYNEPFSTVLGYYTWLIQPQNQPTPYQQLALVPGTFCTDHGCAQQNSNLPNYFSQANTWNQTCNLSLGPRGRTDSYDGCRVWIVMGWLASQSYVLDNTTYYGELNNIEAASIYTAWRAEIQVPLRPDLAHQRTRSEILQTLLHRYLNN